MKEKTAIPVKHNLLKQYYLMFLYLPRANQFRVSVNQFRVSVNQFTVRVN